MPTAKKSAAKKPAAKKKAAPVSRFVTLTGPNGPFTVTRKQAEGVYAHFELAAAADTTPDTTNS